MDDLDRLAFRLVRTVRNKYPHLLEREFTLTDLEERLLPFPEARQELATAGTHAWEVTMLRMVSGERQYLSATADLQLACRQALAQPSPTLALVRPWSASTLRIGALATHISNERQAAPVNDIYPGATTDLAVATTSWRIMPGAASVTAMTTPAMRARPQGARPADPLCPCDCRFCGGTLPGGRQLTFCPHCGVNLTVRQCPACSTELDVKWRFCVTCGRGAGPA